MKKRLTIWPDTDDELLLKAALWKGPEALLAWQELKPLLKLDEQVNFDEKIYRKNYSDVDTAINRGLFQNGYEHYILHGRYEGRTCANEGLYRLLPLVYKNLENLGYKDELTPKLKGMYRLIWYKNQKLCHNVKGILHALHDQGILVMLLKGWPLLTLYYRDLGSRPMKDLDIFVRHCDTLRAIKILREQGWNHKSDWAGPGKNIEPEHNLDLRHACNFANHSGADIDLHWHALDECREAGADDVFWRYATPFLSADLPLCVPHPTEMLLHICLHGLHHNPFCLNCRWLADLSKILEVSCREIAWDRLVVEARRRGFSLWIKECLVYLHEVLQVAIPPQTIRKFAGSVSPKVSLAHKRMAGDVEYTILESLVDYSDNHQTH
ncbi:MAG: nucleotidyltransferase domain-containing protein [Methylococcales bacterium]